jgi:hypothetical protein
MAINYDYSALFLTEAYLLWTASLRMLQSDIYLPVIKDDHNLPNVLSFEALK